MKKSFRFLLILLTLSFLYGCKEFSTDEGQAQIGRTFIDSIDTIQGNKSVIMNISLDYLDSDHEIRGNLNFDIYINNERQWNHIRMMSWDGEDGKYQDYRFVIFEKIMIPVKDLNKEPSQWTRIENVDLSDQYVNKDISTYYEWDPYSMTYSQNVWEVNSEDQNYVLLKASQGHLDVYKMSFSMDSLIEMVNSNAIELSPITSNDPTLEDYDLFKLTLDLNYFIENNTAFLDALYGQMTVGGYSDFVNEKQDVILGFNEQNELKYFAYDQSEVTNDSQGVIVKIRIDSTGTVAEEKMVSIEESPIFPNKNNVKND